MTESIEDAAGRITARLKSRGVKSLQPSKSTKEQISKVTANVKSKLSTEGNKTTQRTVDLKTLKNQKGRVQPLSSLKIGTSNGVSSGSVSNPKTSLKPSIPRQSDINQSKAKPQSITFNVQLPPFVDDIDLLDERIVIKNPSSEIRDLSGWKISDNEGKNVFALLKGTTVAPKGCLHVYCSSKRNESSETLKEPNVFWRNKDGSLRMKNVLNDGKI